MDWVESGGRAILHFSYTHIPILFFSLFLSHVHTHTEIRITLRVLCEGIPPKAFEVGTL